VGEQGPAPPCQPAADLVLVESGQALGGLKAFLDGPSASGDPDQFTKPDQGGAVAAVEGEFAVAGVAADEQPVVSRLGGESDQCPVVGPPLGSEPPAARGERGKPWELKLRARLACESSAGELLVEYSDADQHRRLGLQHLPPAQRCLPRFASLSES